MNAQSLGLISAAIAPAVAFLGGVSLRPHYPYWRNVGSLMIAVMAGCAAAGLALGAETLLTWKPWNVSNLGGLMVFTIAGVGLAEEGAKFLILRTALWRLPSFREAYDGILLAAGVGLGFGALENIFYVLDSGYEVALVRAVTAVPLHGLLGVVMGFYLGQAKVWQLERGKLPAGLVLTGLGLAMAIHGFYDFLAFQNNPVAEALLWGSLGVLALWSWRLISQSRQWSPSWSGGTLPFEDAFYVAPVLKPRSPVTAGLLGLIPGLGQCYNREWQKGGYLASVGVINLLLIVGVAWLLHDPANALITLLSWGLMLGSEPNKILVALQQSPALPLLSTLLASLSLIGATDAYLVARHNRFDYLQAPALRVSWLQSLAVAYGGHLLLAVLLVLVPILSGGGSGNKTGTPGSGIPPISFDLVSEPTTLLGHQDKASGRPDGTATKNQVAKPKLQPLIPTQKFGHRRKSQPSQPATTAKGIPHSYNDYISGELRRQQEKYDVYFSHLLPGEYTVVQYRISPQGEVYDVHIVTENTTAPEPIARLAVEEVEQLNPLLPPPSDGQELLITELFWQYEQVGEPGSLVEKLSRLPDGRLVEKVE